MDFVPDAVANNGSMNQTDCVAIITILISLSFFLTVVIEDDRIDEVLKGMTDKASPGV